jgi:hypothetical protein
MGLPFLFAEKGGVQNKPPISNHNLTLSGKDTKKESQNESRKE